MNGTERRRMYFRQHYFLMFCLIVALIFGLVQTIKVINLTDELEDVKETKNVSAEFYTPHVLPYEMTVTPEPTATPFVWDGPVLDRYAGTVIGPSGKETYYNLPMEGVITIMRDMGFDEEEYPYWVRDDGCKMLGDYIMCAANLDVHPRGTLVESSLGTCLVCDTGEFAYSNAIQLDIAVDW